MEKNLNYELYKLETNKQNILSNIMDRVGEFEENELEALEKIEKDVESNILEFGLLVTDKEIQKQMDKLKSFKKKIDQKVKDLETAKNKIRYQVHKYLQENGPIEYIVDDEKQYLKAGHTTSRTINLDEVEEHFGKYIVTLNAKEYLRMIDLHKNENLSLQGEALLVNILNADTQRKVLISDLDENHSAIIKTLNPQIKSVKKP